MIEVDDESRPRTGRRKRSRWPWLAVPAGVDPTAYERAGYVSALERARSTYGDLRVGVGR